MESLSQSIFIWWVVMVGLSLISMPSATLLFSKADDGGYMAGRVWGLIVIGFWVWWLAFGIAPFKLGTIAVVTILWLLVNLGLGYRKWKELKTIWSKTWIAAIRAELLFGFGFILWVSVRMLKPEINGLEKFMDYGFMNAIGRSEYFPPADMWQAGKSINYYYFGHYLSALMVKITGVRPEVGYNLMLASLVGLCTALAGVIARTLWEEVPISSRKKVGSGILKMLITLLVIFLLVFRGNWHWAAYQLNRLINCPSKSVIDVCEKTTPGLPDVTKLYWYPDATRYIPFTIHEFPIYSFVVADLHAHVINIPLVLTLLLLLISIVRSDRIRWPKVLILGLMLGIFYMTNAWDMPIYMMLSGLAILIKTMHQDKWPKKLVVTVSMTVFFAVISLLIGLKMWRELSTGSAFGIWGVMILVVAISSLGMVGGQYISRFIEEIKSWKKYLDSGYRLALYAGLMIIGAVFTCWKFVINFEQIAQGVTFVNANSTWWELLTLWGWDLFMGLSLLGLIGYKILKGKVVLLVDWLMVSWWLMGVLLIILPELIYVKDIYISDYHRANTMFKLVYQSWTMFAFVGAYTVVRWWHEIREKMLPIKVWLPWFVFSALGIAVMMPYPAKAIDSFYGRFRLNEESNLNGTDWLRVMSPSEANVMDWLNTLPGQPAILESVGESYTEFNRFSAYTGLPTIEGWTVHEWLWRGGYPQERISEVELVYTANSIDETRMLTVDDTDAQLDPLTNSLPKKTVTIGDVRKILDKYNIKYIIVGDKEREKYPNLNEALIASLGKIVFQSGDSRVYEVMSQ